MPARDARRPLGDAEVLDRRVHEVWVPSDRCEDLTSFTGVARGLVLRGVGAAVGVGVWVREPDFGDEPGDRGGGFGVSVACSAELGFGDPFELKVDDGDVRDGPGWSRGCGRRMA